MDNLLRLICHDLSGQHVICQQCPSHIDHICLTGCNNLLHLRRIVQSADGCHRNLHMLFDLRSKIDVAVVGQERAGMRPPKALLITCSGYMQQVDIWLHQLADFNAFRKIIASREKLVAADPQLNGKARTNLCANCL